MLSKKELYLQILETMISWEASISTPATSSWLRDRCLKAMGVTFIGDVWIGENTKFINPDRLTFGKQVCIGESSLLACYEPVVIGDRFLSATGLYINSGSHNLETLEPAHAPITIGDRVWCGMRVTICSGVTIGNDVVLGAGAVVTRSIPDGWLAAGVPAKPIRKICREEFDLYSSGKYAGKNLMYGS